jgi:hypothetical protein
MDIFDSMFSISSVLSEQLVPCIFDVLPENGPVMAIMDSAGNFWSSNSEEFSKLNISVSFLRELCAKVDDGMEPVTTQVENISVTASQLATEQNNYGYVFIVLPQYSSELTLINIDLIEALLNQAASIATLIEKNNQLRELQMKLHGLYHSGITPSN